MERRDPPPVGTKIIIQCAGEDHEVTVGEGGLFHFQDGTEITCVREDFEGWRCPGEKVGDAWQAL